MCGGKADDPPAPAPSPVELPTRRPAESSTRPTTSTARPSTKNRPQSHRRPQSERKQRPPSSSTHPPKTSEHGRRHSSHRDHHTRDGHRPRRDITPIPEYTEDRTIFKHLANLGTLTDQYVISFHPISSPGYTGIPDMDDPRTRHPAIRRYITQKVISSIIMQTDNSPDTDEIAYEIADDLKAYSSSNGERVNHLKQLCKLGDKLRRDIAGHPSSWEFGSLDDDGYIVLVPALYRDEEQVVPSQRFKIN